MTTPPRAASPPLRRAGRAWSRGTGRPIAMLVLMATAAASPQAQKEDPHATMWLAAAGAHRPGAIDEPVRMVAGWSREHAITTVTRALRQSTDTALLIKGLALHTDAAIAERAAVEAGTARGTRSQLLDGQSTGRAPRSLQWEVGRLIANDLATRPAGVGPNGAIPDGVGPARTWYQASSAVLQQWVDLGALRLHLEAGLRVFPTDATLLVYRATLHQAYADPRIQIWVEEDVWPPQNLDAYGRSTKRADVMRIGSPSRELAIAEGDLRAALAVEPECVEARVRLAHVLLAKGEPQEAATLARSAGATSPPPFLDYYAHMVLGRAEQALGRRTEARTAFERAAARFPAAQSARVALSVLAVADGRSGDGVAALVATSGPGVEPGDDPWWSYLRRHEPEAAALLTAFRARAR